MDNNLFAPLDPHHFPPHVPEHLAARTHETAIAEAFARGAGGADGNGRRKAPARCGVCGTTSDYLMGSVDLGEIVCADCADRFDAWADANPGRPYTDFLTPDRAEDAADDLMAVLHGVEVSTPFGVTR